MIRPWVAPLFAFVVACGGGAKEAPLWERAGLYGAVRPEMGSPQPGDAAPDFELPTGDGGTFRSDSLRGSWVVLHFTASWCPYCDAEVEHLGELATSYRSRGVRVVLIDLKEDEARWTAYAAAHVSREVVALRDATGDVAKRFAPPRAQPSFEDRAQVLLDATLIVDPAGKIRLFLFPDSKHFDPSFAAVRAELDRMLASPEPSTANVVTIDARSIARDASTARGEIAIHVRVAPGYHVMSDRPSAPEYIATHLALDGTSALTWGAPKYPQPVPFELADKSIATFQGDTEVRVPYEGAPEARRTIRGTLRYQACTRTRCLFPVTQAFALDVP